MLECGELPPKSLQPLSDRLVQSTLGEGPIPSWAPKLNFGILFQSKPEGSEASRGITKLDPRK